MPTTQRTFDPRPMVASIGSVEDARRVAALREREEYNDYMDSREAREVRAVMNQRFSFAG